jgi:uncharacterized protein YjiK
MGHGHIRIGETRFNTAGARQGDGAPARFESASRINTSVKEASDVVALPGGLLGVVSDTKDSLYVIDKRGRERPIELEGIKGASEFEGVAYDPERHHLFVSREERGQIYRYEWKGGSDEPRLEKKIDVDVEGPKNKGIEGLAYLPEKLSVTGQPQLLAVKEGNPRALLMFRDSGKGKPFEIDLEKQVKDLLRDFSAVAVDPKSGHIFLSSDESSVVAQVRLIRDGAKVRGRLIQALPLRDPKDKPLGRIEGITFSARGDLYVLTENDGALHELKRK